MQENTEFLFPKNVILISQYFRPAVGGAEKQAEKLVNELSSLGWKIEILTGQWNSKWPKTEITPFGKITRLQVFPNILGLKGIRKFQQLWFFFQVYQYLLKNGNQYSVFHAQSGLRVAATVAIAGYKMKKPIITKVISSGLTGDIRMIKQQWFGSWFNKQLFNHLSCLVYTSQAAGEEYKQAGFNSNKMKYIPNGVPIPNTDIYPNTYSNKLKLKIICVSRLSYEKGIDILLHACKMLVNNNISFQLTILGDGPLLSSLKTLSNSLHLDTHVVFQGLVSDPTPWLHDSHVFVLPSRCEGMSNALLEAQAIGLPAIVTRVGANPSMVDQGIQGYLCEPEDPQALADAFLLFITHGINNSPELIRSKIQKQFSMTSVAQQYVNLYEELILKNEAHT
ncbi:MAG: glycosyltransferase family 4 protein [Sphingobacteriia bacterium]|nr:glycosyltransferase family 4 protein [Sphingobacteriia bacterium]